MKGTVARIALLFLSGLTGCAVKINHLPVDASKTGSTAATGPFCSGSRISSTSFAGGSGASGDPYLICTAAQLDLIGQNDSNMAMSFKLAADIDLSSFTSNSFHRIGQVTAFSGGLDGDGHTISKLTLNYSGAPVATLGLFTYLSGATIQNVTLKDFVLKGGIISGALAGRADSAVLSRVSVQNFQHSCTDAACNVLPPNGATGGVIGYARGVQLQFVDSSGDLYPATAYAAGGVIGYLESDSSYANPSISDTHSSINITQVASMGGGLIGQAGGATVANLTITRSYATGEVNVAGGVAGGLIGKLQTFSGSITRSYAKGQVAAASGYAGGLIGSQTSSAISVSDCYATGAVLVWSVATRLSYGGMFGEVNMTGGFARNYSTGPLSKPFGGGWDATNKGFIGSVLAGSCTNCYCVDTVFNNCNGATLSNGGAINNQATFSGWDFATVWSIVEGMSPPTLR